MKFRKLHLRCECGRLPDRIQAVGFTARHELVIQWLCRGCKRNIFVVKTLSDCWRECPTPPEEQLVSEAADVNTSDRQFLRSLGIMFPADVDS